MTLIRYSDRRISFVILAINVSWLTIAIGMEVSNEL
jgi:hypothetical protein